VRIEALTRDEWLADRRDRITGTTAAAILGVSPWSGPWDVYRRVVEGHADEPTDAQADIFARGHDLEAAVLSRLWRSGRYEGGRLIREPADMSLWVTSPARPLWGASPDALVTDGDWSYVGGVEVKTVSRSDLGRYWDDDDPEPAWVRGLDGRDVRPGDAGEHVPPAWLVQCLVYLEVTGLPWWDLAVYGPHIDQLAVVRIWRDEETQAGIVARVEDWWARHIVGREPPPLDTSDACADSLRARWPDDVREAAPVAALDGAADGWAAVYDAARSASKAAEEQRKMARAHLLDAIGAHKRATSDRYSITLGRNGALTVRSRA